MPQRLIDISGLRFGWIVVLRRVDSKGYWECICDCGRTSITTSGSLRKGSTKSCGCQQRVAAANTASAHRRTHGMNGTPIYKIWVHMKQRCSNPNAANYPRYGGRGITVCERWLKFENFLSDMGERPSSEHSLDRIKIDGNYEPSNCRWATWFEQNNNHSKNNILELNGERLTTAQWARKFNVNYNTLKSHLWAGKDLESAKYIGSQKWAV